MNKESVDEKFAALRLYFENESGSARQRLDQQLKYVAELNIASILVEFASAVDKARRQYEAEITLADAYAHIPELVSHAKELARRQLEVSINGYGAIAKRAIESILDMTKR